MLAFKTPLASEALAAFENLKTALTSAPVLSYFDSNRSTELFVDASTFSIGAVLQQVQDFRVYLRFLLVLTSRHLSRVTRNVLISH